MIKQTDKTKKEKQASELWAGFYPKKEGGFWKKYEALLQDRTFVQTETFEQYEARAGQRTKVAEEKKEVFRPELFTYIWRLLFWIVSWGGLARICLHVLERGFSPGRHPGDQADDVFAFIFITFFLLTLPLLWLRNLKAITVTNDRLAVSEWLFMRKNSVAWGDLNKVEVTSKYGTHYLNLYTSDKEKEYSFVYTLQKADHWVFFAILSKYNIPTKCESKYYNQTLKLKI